MLKTPETLQRDFGIPADAGHGRAVPRLLLAYAGADKAQFLATTIAMTVAGALPEYGGKRRASQPVDQEQLAAMCGIARPSFTRRLSRFATPDITMDADRRSQNSARMKERRNANDSADSRQGDKHQGDTRRRSGTGAAGCDPLAGVDDEAATSAGDGAVRQQPGRDSGTSDLRAAHRNRARSTVLVHRTRRFAAPNMYGWALPAQHDPKRPDRFLPPSLDQVLADVELRSRFEASGPAGFKDIPQWLWDARLPLTDTARLVMSYYFLIGMLDPRKRDRTLYSDAASCVAGVVNPRQATVARALGISIKSVYNANRELSGKGAPKYGVRDAAGKLVAWFMSKEAAQRECDARNAKAETRNSSAGPLAPITLIRVAHPKPERGPDGGWRRGPAKIVYLPVRTLTLEEAEAERQRLRRAILRHTQGQEARGMMRVAADVHEALLRAWQGHEHALRAFWNECRRAMMAAGVHRTLCDELIPPPPE